MASNRAPVSSVEAARKFLEQVGLSNKDGDSNAPPTPSAPPNRFPGEDGGFLKEVSTRRVPKSNPALASSPTSQSTFAIDKATEAPLLPVKPLEQSQEKRAPIRSDVAADSSGGKLRLSAYEFYRRLHQCSGNGLDTEAKHKSQLALLAVRIRRRNQIVNTC